MICIEKSSQSLACFAVRIGKVSLRVLLSLNLINHRWFLAQFLLVLDGFASHLGSKRFCSLHVERS